MGKPSRRPNRRSRRARASAVVSEGKLKIVVATHPAGGGADVPVDLEADVRLVRSALLYADEVELLSPGAMMMASVQAVAQSGSAGMLAVLASLDDQTLDYLSSGRDRYFDVNEFRATLRQLVEFTSLPREQRRAPAGRRIEDGMRKYLASSAGSFRDVASGLLAGSGGGELDAAARAGVLRLNADAFADATDTSRMIDGYVARLKNLLTDPSAHLLFDPGIAKLVQALVREGHVQPHQLTASNAAKSQTGSGLAARLPAFADSSVEDILMARDDLADPLGRYRRSVVQLSGQLASDAFDPAVEHELDDMWRDEVAPALADLRADLGAHSISRSFVRSIAEDPKAVVTAGSLWFGVGMVAGAPEVVSAAAGVSGLAVSSVLRTLRGRDDVKKRDLYYLLEINERLRK